MYKFVSLLVCFLCLGGYQAHTQNTTYLSIESGPKFEYFHILEGGSLFDFAADYMTPIASAMVGRSFLDNRLLVEVGAGIAVYGEWNPSIERGSKSGGSAIAATVHFPIRASFRIPTGINGLSINPGLGYRLGLNADYHGPGGSGGSGGSFLDGEDSIHFRITDWNQFDQMFHLVGAFGAIEYQFKKGHALYLSGTYYTGFSTNQIVIRQWRYTRNNIVEEAQWAELRGSFSSMQIGFRFPLARAAGEALLSGKDRSS